MKWMSLIFKSPQAQFRFLNFPSVATALLYHWGVGGGRRAHAPAALRHGPSPLLPPPVLCAVAEMAFVKAALLADGWRRSLRRPQGWLETRAGWIPSCEVRLVAPWLYFVNTINGQPSSTYCHKNTRPAYNQQPLVALSLAIVIESHWSGRWCKCQALLFGRLADQQLMQPGFRPSLLTMISHQDELKEFNCKWCSLGQADPWLPRIKLKPLPNWYHYDVYKVYRRRTVIVK